MADEVEKDQWSRKSVSSHQRTWGNRNMTERNGGGGLVRRIFHQGNN